MDVGALLGSIDAVSVGERRGGRVGWGDRLIEWRWFGRRGFGVLERLRVGGIEEVGYVCL